MTYTAVYTATARKQFAKLSRADQLRVNGALERIRVQPHRHLRRMVGQNCYRLRAGDIRVLADVDGTQLTILVLTIKHRRNIYKKR